MEKNEKRAKSLIFYLVLRQWLAYKRSILSGTHPELSRKQLLAKLEASFLRIASLEQSNFLLAEELRLLRIKKYGSGAERLSDGQLALLELEPGVCAAEVASEAVLAPADTELAASTPLHEPARKQPVRGPLPEHLPRVERIVHVPAQDCLCAQCGAAKKLIGYQTSERLAIKPIELYVEVTKREKLACAHCEELGVSIAPVPATIIEKGILADSLVVETIVKKYCDHSPLYRQAAGIGRDAGVELSQATLSSSVLKAGELLTGVVAAMKAELLAGEYIQADETTVPVQSNRTKGKNHQAYLWEYSVPHGLVVYDFQMGRAREGPANFLAPFGGRLQSDGYAAYGNIGGPSLLHFGCWAHVRRKFFDAAKLDPKDVRCVSVVAAIGALYELERQAREANLTFSEREALRARECPSRLAALKTLITQSVAGALPKSALGKACKYALKQWERLERYAEPGHGMVEIDNNWAENAMRGVALGRKNWIQIGSESAGPKVAALLSVLETCKRLGLNAREYLLEVLPVLAYQETRPGLSGVKTAAELTPTAWVRLRTARVQ